MSPSELAILLTGHHMTNYHLAYTDPLSKTDGSGASPNVLRRGMTFPNAQGEWGDA
jgi:hypothetical protein